MAIAVSGVVGALAALCVMGLTNLVEAEPPEMIGGGVCVWVRRTKRKAVEAIEKVLTAWGVELPGKRAARKRIEGAMPEVFGALSISLGSGLSLPQAMQYVGDRANGEVRTELLHAASLMTCGVSASDALDELVERLRAPGMELVTLAMKVSGRTGAPLGGLLADAAHMVEERLALSRKLDVKTAQVRMSAHVVAAMPFVMVTFLSLVSSDFRSGALTAAGMGSIVAAMVLNGIAWVIIRRVMQVMQ